MSFTNSQEKWSTWPTFSEEQIEAASGVLRSGNVNYWTGQEGRMFEKEFAEFVGSQYAVAVANGTVALELALKAAGVQPGDEVIVPSRTFIATASAAVVCGAVPICADVDSHSHNVTAESLAEQITPRTKAIIVVHFAGWPCDMDSISELAKRHNLVLIEDCAQAHGARYKGRSVGSLGDVAAFSFCQDKIMTTAGEGGMVVTNSEELWRRVWSYKDHGKSYHAVYEKEHPPGYRWLHESFGTNMRMTEVQSAVGRVALRELAQWVELRRKNADVLIEAFQDLDALVIPQPPSEVFHSFYKFYVSLMPDRLRPDWNRDRVMESISAKGVFCRVCSCSEIYLERAFENSPRPDERLPGARYLTESSFGLLVDPTLSEEKMRFAAKTVAEIVSQASLDPGFAASA